MLLAQAADQTSVLVQYGALGVLTLAAMAAVRALFQRETRTLELERQRRERLENELRELNESIRREHIPILERATTAIAQALETIRKYESR
jgi:hypothetical protein